MNELTNEQKRIKIAEALGWKRREPFLNAIGTMTQQWEKAGEINGDGCGGHTLDELPDYFEDLNAMHEAEETLTEEQRNQYLKALNGPYMGGAYGTGPGFYDWWRTTHATAAQRAEAFGKTCGLW